MALALNNGGVHLSLPCRPGDLPNAHALECSCALCQRRRQIQNQDQFLRYHPRYAEQFRRPFHLLRPCEVPYIARPREGPQSYTFQGFNPLYTMNSFLNTASKGNGLEMKFQQFNPAPFSQTTQVWPPLSTRLIERQINRPCCASYRTF